MKISKIKLLIILANYVKLTYNRNCSLTLITIYFFDANGTRIRYFRYAHDKPRFCISVCKAYRRSNHTLKIRRDRLHHAMLVGLELETVRLETYHRLFRRW